MNLYFLVEGKTTEMEVYPRWLAYLLPSYSQIEQVEAVSENNYYLICGFGIPSIFTRIKNAIREINEIEKFDYFFICLDAEESSISETKNLIHQKILSEHLTLKNCKLVIIVQNRCIETWFLGNRKIFPRQPEREKLKSYIEFYSVKNEDPELMPIFGSFSTHAKFHLDYLKEIFAERNIRYSKNNLEVVCQEYFVRELQIRTEGEEAHLPSLKYFFEVLEKVQD